MPQQLRSDIIAFYGDLGAPISTKANYNDWATVLKDLDRLRAVDTDLGHPPVAAVRAQRSQ